MIRQIFREANLPLPTEKVDAKGKVKWGVDNLYPQFLNGLYYDNPIHQGIIDQKTKFITAGGITVTDPTAEDNGNSAFTLTEIVEIIAKDNEIANAFAIHWKKDVLTGKWYALPLDYELVRCLEGLNYFEVSDDWSKTSQTAEKTGYKRLKNIKNVTDEDLECIQYNIERPKQRKIEKSKDLTANYYPAPPYSGAITSIMAGIEMDFFTFSEVINGYKGGAVIALNDGVPESEQEEDKIIKRIKEDATDRDKQGGLTILFSDGKDRAPEIHQMNGNDLDKRYIESNKEILRKIMIAHGVISPALFGVLSESMFGSKEEMEIAYKLFQENYAKARQNTIEEALNWAWEKLNKTQLGLTFNDYILSLDQNVAETNAVSSALNGMSPLVANKVLTALTVNEIRALARLAPIANGDTIPSAAPSGFKAMDPIIDAFSKVGTDRDSVNIISSREYNDYEDNEDEFKREFLSNRFAVALTDDDRNILQMIKAGESYDAISKAIGKGGAYLSKRLFVLKDNGYVDGWNITDKGQSAAAVIAELEVVYSYEKRPNAPDLVPGGSSRPFCEALIELNRVYTRLEIDAISAQVDRDVWRYRGGWYHNPNTEVNTPSCRHQWKQNIIVR
jgi:hypothetical protein